MFNWLSPNILKVLNVKITKSVYGWYTYFNNKTNIDEGQLGNLKMLRKKGDHLIPIIGEEEYFGNVIYIVISCIL